MFKIAIPSYNRYDMIQNKTLKFLDNAFKGKYEIYIFTPNNEYIELDEKYNIVKCKAGLINARNEIMAFFDVDQPLLILDDDIENVINLSEDELDIELEKNFKYMINNNIRLGSINPTGNKFFSSLDYKKGLIFCVGCFYLLINDRYYINCNDEMEDYERSILYYIKYGNLFRNDKMLVITHYEKNKGGMFSSTRYESKSSRSIHLLSTYPNYCLITRKKNYFGLRLKTNKKTIIYKVKHECQGLINGMYSNRSSCLDPKKNYIFMYGNVMLGFLIRNIFKIGNLDYSVKDNQNSGDIAGIIEKERLDMCFQKIYDEYDFNKQKTRTAKNEKHKFEISNTIRRKSGKIQDCEKMTEIYDKVKHLNIFNNMNSYVINKNLVSGYHRDIRNKEPYILLITKNNKLDLELPEFDLVINNRDDDILIFNAKKYFHGNNKGDSANRYSIVFFNK